MPKRISKRSDDVNEATFEMVQRATSVHGPKRPDKPKRSEIAKVMRAMGQKGGKIGGKRRLETMTPEQRREAALKAARARWDKGK